MPFMCCTRLINSSSVLNQLKPLLSTNKKVATKGHCRVAVTAASCFSDMCIPKCLSRWEKTLPTHRGERPRGTVWKEVSSPWPLYLDHSQTQQQGVSESPSQMWDPILTPCNAPWNESHHSWKKRRKINGRFSWSCLLIADSPGTYQGKNFCPEMLPQALALNWLLLEPSPDRLLHPHLHSLLTSPHLHLHSLFTSLHPSFTPSLLCPDPWNPPKTNKETECRM